MDLLPSQFLHLFVWHVEEGKTPETVFCLPNTKREKSVWDKRDGTFVSRAFYVIGEKFPLE